MSTGIALLDPTSGADLPLAPRSAIGHMNVGYMWMFVNCVASAGYVNITTAARRRRSLMYRLGALHAEAHQDDRVQGLGLDVLQQPPLHPDHVRLLCFTGGLEPREPDAELVSAPPVRLAPIANLTARQTGEHFSYPQ
jgi:hypothetical protein